MQQLVVCVLHLISTQHCLDMQGMVLPVTGKPFESSVRLRLRALRERLNCLRESAPLVASLDIVEDCKIAEIMCSPMK